MRLEQHARCTVARDAQGGLDGRGTDARVWSLPRQTTAPARRAMMSREGAKARRRMASGLQLRRRWSWRCGHRTAATCQLCSEWYRTTGAAEPPTPWRRHERCHERRATHVHVVVRSALPSTARTHARHGDAARPPSTPSPRPSLGHRPPLPSSCSNACGGNADAPRQPASDALAPTRLARLQVMESTVVQVASTSTLANAAILRPIHAMLQYL